jgi:hypothetical protein
VLSNKDRAIGEAYADNQISKKVNAEAIAQEQKHVEIIALGNKWLGPAIERWMAGKTTRESLDTALKDGLKRFSKDTVLEGGKTMADIAESDYNTVSDKFLEARKTLYKTMNATATGVTDVATWKMNHDNEVAAQQIIVNDLSRQRAAARIKLHVEQAEREVVSENKTIGEGVARVIGLEGGGEMARPVGGTTEKTIKDNSAKAVSSARGINKIMEGFGAADLSPKQLSRLWKQTELDNPDAIDDVKKYQGVLESMVVKYQKNPESAKAQYWRSDEDFAQMTKALSYLRAREYKE